MATKKNRKLTNRQKEYELRKNQIREAAENDLETFIRLVAPHRVLGSVHCELLNWWTRQEKKSHQLNPTAS